MTQVFRESIALLRVDQSKVLYSPEKGTNVSGMISRDHEEVFFSYKSLQQGKLKKGTK